MISNNAKIQAIMNQTAKAPRGRGRPPKNLPAGRFVRLTKELEAAVELHRRGMESAHDEPVDFSKALRDLIRSGLIAKGVIEPPAVS